MEGIIDGVADTQERREKYLRTIYTKANDMDRLINELTYYSSIDNNRIPYNFHRINVAEYTRSRVMWRSFSRTAWRMWGWIWSPKTSSSIIPI